MLVQELALSDTFFKLISWYDNEWGYSNRCVDLLIEARGRLYLKFQTLSLLIPFRTAEPLMAPACIPSTRLYKYDQIHRRSGVEWINAYSFVRVDFNVPLDCRRHHYRRHPHQCGHPNHPQTFRVRGQGRARRATSAGPKGERDSSMSLAPVAPALAEPALGLPVLFLDDCVGE